MSAPDGRVCQIDQRPDSEPESRTTLPIALRADDEQAAAPGKAGNDLSYESNVERFDRPKKRLTGRSA